MNAPEDSAFKQQRLKAWQPILTPLWVILTFLVIGVIFIPIGVILKGQADAVFEQSITYDSTSPQVDCRISTPNEGYARIANDTEMECDLIFNITQDIPADSLIHVYYQLTNFFQNHRRYVKSRSDNQLGGEFVADADLAVACDPAGSFEVTGSEEIFAPCGLIATSFFNDAFFLEKYNGVNPSVLSVSMDESGIAWESDLNDKFKNPTNPADTPAAEQPLNNWSKYQYLWQTYDQMSCYDKITGDREACQTWSDVVGEPVFGNGCANCSATQNARYEGGIPPPGGRFEFDPMAGAAGDALSAYGFRDEHFIVWMRTAGLPTFRKLYGTLKAPSGGFKEGDSLIFRVVPNFEVGSFGSTKTLILSTTTPTGGKSSVLGVAYLAVGSICVALAISFGFKHLVAPRKLGDPQYIVAKHG